jgi:hypothetical protein
MIEAEITKPTAEVNPDSHHRHRRSAGVADDFADGQQ